MKKLIYITFTFFLTLGFTSCEDDNEVFVNPNINNTGKVTYSGTGPFVLDKNNATNNVITINWEKPDFGYEAVPTYQILVDLENGDFSTPQIIECNNKLTYTFTHQELNALAIALGVNPNEATNLKLKLQAKVGVGIVYQSPIQVITITPYSALLDLSTTWGIVGSGYNNWGATPDAPLYKTAVEGVLVGYVDLVDGEIKFRENNAWDSNYGGSDGKLEAGGANISVTAGSYKVTMNLNDMSYAIEPFSLGIVGSAYNDWGNAGSDFKLNYDQYSDTFRGVVALQDGEFKFRLNNQWNGDWGGENGSLVSGGANIPSTYGNYIVIVDLNKNTYYLEVIENIWGLVGSAAPNGWDGPNVKFTRDWSKPDKDIWVLNNVTVTDGEIKFRANDAWAVNYGDDGNDGTLEVGGANIPITAGTYNFTLDFSNANAPTYTKIAL